MPATGWGQATTKSAGFPVQAAASSSVGLDPAFRLPVGGRPQADPVIDLRASPAAVWILSEDHNLYLVTESGVLLSRTVMPARILPFLALDSAGRALVIQAGGEEGGQKVEARILAWTRSGRLALALGLGPALGAALDSAPPSLVMGADGRIFVGAGRELRCFAASGSLLWQRSLESPLACPLGLDGSGRLLVGLSASVLVLSPYGVEEGRLALGAAPTVLGAFSRAAWRELASARGKPIFAAGTADGSLVLVGAGSGLEVLATASLGAAPLALATDGSLLYALSSSGRLVSLDQGGKLLWSVETRVTGGRLGLFQDRLVATGKGRAVSVRRDGYVLREASFTNSAAASVVSPTGLLFSPGADWILGAYNFEPTLGPALKSSPPPYGDATGVVEENQSFDPLIADSSRRLALLADIEKELDAGSLGADEGRAGAFAAAVALGSFEKRYPAREARFRQDPLPRARAVYLLGRMGSPERIGVLCEVFRTETDDAVRASALDAIARIGVDPQGLAGAAIEAAVGRKGRLGDETALSLARAVESLALRSGNPPPASSVRGLLALSQSPYGAEVREAAQRALSRIAGTLGP